MANAWDDFWGNLTRPINFGPVDENKRQSVMNRGAGFSDRNQMGDLHKRSQFNPGTPQRALSTSRLPGMREDSSNVLSALRGKYNSPQGQEGVPPMLARPEEPDPMDKLMERRAQLEAMLDEDFTGDPEVDALIEQAYTSALANIGKARSDANSNFKQSDENIARLTAGHVNTIKTEDRDAVNRIGNELEGNYNKTFNTAKSGLEANRSAELAERTKMLQRLGIQEAGLGEAGRGETEDIARMTQDQAGAMQQAQTYKAADLVRNTEQAQSQASAGVERRSDLNKQLQGILGNLGEAEANLGVERAQNQLQARQSGKSDHLRRMGMISDQIAGIDDRIDSRTDADRDYSLEMQKLAQKNSGAGGGVFDVVNESFRNRGLDPAQYEQAYAQVAASTPYNSQVDGDKSLWLIRQMKKKNPRLSENDIGRYVMGINNYGTDKLGN